MYYHNSPTVKQIKAIKKAQADDMKRHLAAMRSTTNKFSKTLELLETLRKQELFIENERSAGRLVGDRLVEAEAIIKHNRGKAERQVKRLLPGFIIE